MTTKIALVSLLLDRAIKQGEERKWLYCRHIAHYRELLGPGPLAEELEKRCGPPFDAGVLADYVDKEFLSFKAAEILKGTTPQGLTPAAREAMGWNPSPEEKAYAADVLGKIVRVMRE